MSKLLPALGELAQSRVVGYVSSPVLEALRSGAADDWGFLSNFQVFEMEKPRA